MARATRPKTKRPIGIEASSGNVFADLGLPNADERLAKAELARVIRAVVKGKSWTQRRAADVLGIAPPDVSDLMRGKLCALQPVSGSSAFSMRWTWTSSLRCGRARPEKGAPA